jgi:hypothetical protein
MGADELGAERRGCGGGGRDQHGRETQREKLGRHVFYSPNMRALDVIGMVENPELYQTLVGISNPWWSCSMVELHGSATLELFFRVGALPNTS